ncbi:S8 family serine peptidase [Streptacidiphilus sp. ASG 303]|uniref:S8 family serine peptidase n=1 Tax=Streptacidiphilus sp. ASG 303 TaxID=2896847 RepID=UPI001E501045|nr:S8 family serine peptidase [Streptacidiphilus sp. ASG 303]MCD0484298.1 S8 family serine peptidase [Streptacidiphilus sp. ASG 303]
MTPRRRNRPTGLVLGIVLAAAAALTGAAPGRPAGPPEPSAPVPAPAEPAAAGAPAPGGPAGGRPADGPYADGLYVVQLADAPVASYGGGTAGLPATRPQPGARLDTGSPAVRAYRERLRERRGRVLARVPGVRPVYSYDYALDGFAAYLTGRQAAELAAADGVASLERSELLPVESVSTAGLLGLSGSGGVWERRFGGAAHAGEGVVIGVVDSGFTPESPLFAPLPEPRPDAEVVARHWKGSCDPGEEAPVSCSNKVIGARYYHQGVTPVAAEYLSPRDHGGHGTHTASTAAGDAGVEAVVNGTPAGEAGGVAPAARLAVYKACWTVDADGNQACATADTVAAVDQAVADGVDVLNYSVSGSTSSVVNSVEAAFYNAAHAGVFVAAAAGNSDTGRAGTVAHDAPWVTTVAASTHDRRYRTVLTLGDGSTLTGVGTGAAVPSAPLADAAAAAADGADPALAAQCRSGSLDPGRTAGRIVVCERGGNDRTDKSRAVREAGGVGMVLRNTADGDTLEADFHHVPTVHLDRADGDRAAAYARTPGATAALSASEAWSAPAPAMAPFSAVGPAVAGGGDLLKPDLTAPGVDVLAGTAPDSADGNGFGTMSGTSVAAPHVAGIAALLLSRHPKWSPAEVKSALMTTAYRTDNRGAPIPDAGGRPATPFAYGAGHVDPDAALDPGLVYRADWKDWQKYVCAVGQRLPAGTGAEGCDGVERIQASDLNSPSVAVGALAGTRTVVRKVYNVGAADAVYTARVEAPPGFTASVSPPVLAVGAGEGARYKVVLTRTTAPLDTWAFGSLTWTDGVHAVRSPVAVRPVALAPAPEASAAGRSGSVLLQPQAGYAGTLNARVRGLSPAEVTVEALHGATGAAFDTARPAAGDHTAVRTAAVPAGTRLLRFTAAAPGGADVDLYLYRRSATGALTLWTTSAVPGGGSETVQVRSPAAGTWVLFADLRAAPGGGGAADATVAGWLLGDGPAGNAVLVPASAAVGTGDRPGFRLDWSGLQPGRRYLGSVVWDDGARVLGYSEVEVAAD